MTCSIGQGELVTGIECDIMRFYISKVTGYDIKRISKQYQLFNKRPKMRRNLIWLIKKILLPFFPLCIENFCQAGSGWQVAGWTIIRDASDCSGFFSCHAETGFVLEPHEIKKTTYGILFIIYLRIYMIKSNSTIR